MKASKAFVIYNILDNIKRAIMFLITSKVINMHFNTNALRSIAWFYKLKISIKELFKKYFSFISNYLAKILVQLLK